jgi:hypothetical protein
VDKRIGWIGGGAAAAIAIGGVAWWLTRTDTPDHVLVQRDGAIEVRDYLPLKVAQTIVAGTREKALDKGFERLADYIFARKRPGGKIAMTAPVLSDGAGADGWRTRFLMPEDAGELPDPQPGVELATIPARRMAAIRFSGNADDAMLAEREADLRAWIEDAGHRVAGPAEHAFYNAPFVPGPLRRNEVLIPLN